LVATIDSRTAGVEDLSATIVNAQAITDAGSAAGRQADD